MVHASGLRLKVCGRLPKPKTWLPSRCEYIPNGSFWQTQQVISGARLGWILYDILTFLSHTNWGHQSLLWFRRFIFGWSFSISHAGGNMLTSSNNPLSIYDKVWGWPCNTRCHCAIWVSVNSGTFRVCRMRHRFEFALIEWFVGVGVSENRTPALPNGQFS